MYMYELSGFFFIIERRRERERESQSERFLMMFVVQILFEEMEVFDCVFKGLINICFVLK